LFHSSYLNRDNYIKTRDGYQIGRLPMVKASVRAVDSLIAFIQLNRPDVIVSTFNR